ncbi:uncharacterized protein TA09880 [Theileria annulata]|uniref:UFSP1/2/DUB catalytic domain-containing protein n=1 Tax=Theileria annulata TaxID=5874 RepID=Q4U8N9_THEAN|nr:uncharacterized protein TA09880 [Theileria annulata]CAI76814.1 hypothetical protein, conserved [Theileria annulata]|eukprot:XP_953439.1 hypothetical protein, conserved [Theileria annulata]
MLIHASVLFFSKLSFNEDSETNVTKPGVYKMEDLPNSLKDSLVDSLKSCLTKLKSDEPSCKLVYSEPFEQNKDKLSEFYPVFSLGFGFNSRGRKHVFIVCGEYEDCSFSFKLFIQNTVLINLEQSEEDLISKSVLDKTHDQLSKLCSYMTNDINSLSCYVSVSTEKNTQELFLNYFNEFPESDQKTVTRNSNPRSGNKSNKSKNVKSAPKTENKVKNKDKNKIFNVVPLLEMFGSQFALKLDTTTGALSLALNKELPKVIDKDEENDKNTCLNLVFKFLMSSSSYTESVNYVPFGGTVVPFFDFSSHSNLSLDGVFENSSKLKTVFNPYDLVDKTILVSPHRAINAYPGWISPKKSTVSMVQGNYQYYHYTQMGVNDTGWGCCYRSLQLVCSWYLLGYHTTKLVPTHSKIQEVLKENDVSHKDLKVGSNTWIGTVECGYFLNWYLGYMYKTLYLNDVSEFRNYNVVIADHLKSQGTPVIVGAGAYAYVILGICVESEQGEVAYLIADPHYTGEDSIKNVVNKGGIGWKKVGFLSKASEGKFINLCLPLLEKYGV